MVWSAAVWAWSQGPCVPQVDDDSYVRFGRLVRRLAVSPCRRPSTEPLSTCALAGREGVQVSEALRAAAARRQRMPSTASGSNRRHSVDPGALRLCQLCQSLDSPQAAHLCCSCAGCQLPELIEAPCTTPVQLLPRQRLFLGYIEDPGGGPHRNPESQW